MTKQRAISTALAASVLFSAVSGTFAQAPSPHAKTPADATGSGRDTGMQVPSGMSGNGPGGVGTVASPAATGGSTSTAGTSNGRSSASKGKKSVKHSKKHSASRTSASR